MKTTINQRKNKKMPNDMNPNEIRVELLRRGVTQAEIAEELGVTPGAVSRVIDGNVVSHRIRTVIAKKIKIDPRFIWPSTYILLENPSKRGRRTMAQKRKLATKQ